MVAPMDHELDLVCWGWCRALWQWQSYGGGGGVLVVFAPHTPWTHLS